MPPDPPALLALLLLDHAWCELRRHHGFNDARREFRTSFEATHGTEWYALHPTQERIMPRG